MFEDEQDDTFIDLSTHTILWNRYMQLGKEHLAAGDIADAIRLFTLAENTVMRTRDLLRQTESLVWLIMAYNAVSNLLAAQELLERAMSVMDQLDAKRVQEFLSNVVF